MTQAADLGVPDAPLYYAMAKEHVNDPNLWDDCVQEAAIHVWRLRQRGEDRPPAYYRKAARTRIREVAKGQVFFGHENPEPEVCGAWMPRAKQHCARAPFHKGDHNTAKAARRKMLGVYSPIDPLRRPHESLDQLREQGAEV